MTIDSRTNTPERLRNDMPAGWIKFWNESKVVRDAVDSLILRCGLGRFPCLQPMQM
jgi:hypothetical protein